jgi:hypothetical protein
MTIRTVVDGREATLTEYLCDWPDCPNVAVETLGVIAELRLRAAVCAEHAALLAKRRGEASPRRKGRVLGTPSTPRIPV